MAVMTVAFEVVVENSGLIDQEDIIDKMKPAGEAVAGEKVEVV